MLRMHERCLTQDLELGQVHASNMPHPSARVYVCPPYTSCLSCFLVCQCWRSWCQCVTGQPRAGVGVNVSQANNSGYLHLTLLWHQFYLCMYVARYLSTYASIDICIYRHASIYISCYRIIVSVYLMSHV